MNVVKLTDAPDGQIQLWLYRPSLPSQWSDLHARLLGYGIAALEGWSHMAIRMDNVVWSAEAVGFIPCNAVAETRYRGEIRVFTWEPPLTEAEHNAARQCLAGMEGAWYDWLLFGQRLLKHVFGFIDHFIGNPLIDLVKAILPVDVMADRAVICYESAARVINAIGRQKVDPATFGPRDLLGGPMKCLGTLEKAS